MSHSRSKPSSRQYNNTGGKGHFADRGDVGRENVVVGSTSPVPMMDEESIAKDSRLRKLTRCRQPNRDGSACNTCSGCQSYRRVCRSFSTFMDAWKDVFDEPSVKIIGTMDGIWYDYATRQPTPGETGAVFTAGVSQVIILTPSSMNNMSMRPMSSIRVVTLAAAADFPTAATLPAGGMAIYLPLGSNVNAGTQPESYLSLSGVTAANLSVYSTSYPTAADVPFSSFNALWRCSPIFSLGDKTFYSVKLFMITTEWRVQIERLVSSLNPPPGVPALLQVAGVTSDSSWSLALTTIARYQALRPIYMTGVRAARDSYDECNTCSRQSGGCGCNKFKCGQSRAIFGIHHGGDVLVDSRGNPHNDVYHSKREIDMIRDVLENGSISYAGLTVDKKTGRVVVSSVSDNLANVDRVQLRQALDVAKRIERITKRVDGHAQDNNYSNISSLVSQMRSISKNRQATLKLASRNKNDSNYARKLAVKRGVKLADVSDIPVVFNSTFPDIDSAQASDNEMKPNSETASNADTSEEQKKQKKLSTVKNFIGRNNIASSSSGNSISKKSSLFDGNVL